MREQIRVYVQHCNTIHNTQFCVKGKKCVCTVTCIFYIIPGLHYICVIVSTTKYHRSSLDARFCCYLHYIANVYVQQCIVNKWYRV